MAGVNPQMIVRIAANLDELRKNIAEGKQSIETTTAAMNKLAASFQGDRLIQAAHNVTAAVNQIGGAAKLTDAEQARVNATLTKAIEKYSALGREAPQAMKDLAAATQQAGKAGDGWGATLGKLNGLLGVFGASLSIGAVVAFGRELLRMGDDIVRVADRTGLTTIEVQRLSYIAGQSGNTLDELTGAVGRLQKNLVTGDAGAVHAVKALGLSLASLKTLSPYEQVEQVATAIAKVQDPAARAALAIELFGKSGAAILPTLVSHFADLGREAPVMSDKTVRALDAAGDALAKFTLQLKVWAAESYNWAGRAFDQLVAWSFQAVAGLYRATAGLLELTAKIPGASAVMNALGISTASLREQAQWFTDAAKAQTAQLQRVEPAVRKAATATLDYAEMTGKAGQAATKAAAEFSKLKERIADIERGAPEATFRLLSLADALEQVGGTHVVPSLRDVQQNFLRSATDAQVMYGSLEQLQRRGRHASAAIIELNRGFATLPDAVDPGVAAMREWREGLGQAEAKARSFGDYLRKDLGGIILGALQGGGNVAKSLGGAIGGFMTSATSSVGKAVGGALSSALGSTIGGALGSVLPGVGTMLGSLGGQLLGGLIGKLGGGPSKEQLAARDEQAKVVEQLNAIATAAQKAEMAVASGSAAYRTLAVVGRDAMLGIGKSASEADVVVKGLLDTEHPARFTEAMQQVQAALKLQGEAQQTLTETVQRYKFTIEELGPAYAGQKLSEQAQQLYKDWQVLTQAGVNTVAVAREMSGATNEYIQTAMKMGIEVPSAMKPMIEAMIAQGVLTDASGTKIKDLEGSGIKFAQTMTEGFKSIVDSVKMLTDVMRRGLGLAVEETAAKINAIPRKVDVEMNILERHRRIQQEAAESEYGALGGLVTRAGLVRHLAEGGHVVPFVPRGTDVVPAMLTPGERVLTVAENRAYEAGARSGAVVNFAELKTHYEQLRQEVSGLRRDLRGLPSDLAIQLGAAVALQRRR